MDWIEGRDVTVNRCSVIGEIPRAELGLKGFELMLPGFLFSWQIRVTTHDLTCSCKEVNSFQFF